MSNDAVTPKVDMEQITYLLGVDYTEFKPETYKGIVLYVYDGVNPKTEVFRANGDPELSRQKRFEANYRQMAEVLSELELDSITCVSSLDSYIQDSRIDAMFMELDAD